MIVLKVGRTWKHVGAMPLFRALVLDGVLYYFIFIIALSLEIIAKRSSEVGKLHFYHVIKALTPWI